MPRLRCAALLALALALWAADAPAQPAAPDVPLALDGRWDLLLDRENTGLRRGLQAPDASAWNQALKVAVPGALEAQPQASGYDGVAWYRTSLPAASAPPGGRLWLEFAAADWRAEAWLDGVALGRHDGPGAFRFDLTGRLDTTRTLVVRVVDPGERRVDDLLLQALPSGMQAFLSNPGGLLGPVALVPTGEVELRRHDLRLRPEGAVELRVDLAHHGTAARAVRVLADLGGHPGEQALELPPGETSLLLSLPGAAGLARWSPAEPVRHALTLRVVDADGGELARAEGLGALRRFAARGQAFELDGQPLRLRAVSLPPTWPRTLVHAPDRGWPRRELLAIRSAGFNAVCTAQAIAPETWALCDELGLLVLAEPPLGRITHELPLTQAAVEAALAAFAQAVQGHPSVVAVTLLDGGGGLLWRQHDALLARAQALLPERLLLSDGGGATGAARLANPHEAPLLPYEDLRLSGCWPLAAEEAAALEALGADGRLAFVSRWSAPGLPALLEDVAGYGAGLNTQDAAQAVAALQSVTSALAGTPLGQVAGNLAQLVALGQASQARAVRALAARLAAHPRLAGDCHAAWREAGPADGSALCDLWGRPRPAVAVFGGATLPVPAPLEVPERPRRPFVAGSLVGLTPAVSEVLAPLVERPGATPGLPRLAVLGPQALDWSPQGQPVTVALLRFARDGGTLLLLDPPAGTPAPLPDLGRRTGPGACVDLPVDVALRPAPHAGAPGLLLFAEGTLLLADLPLGLRVLDERLAAVAPAHVLTSPPGADVELACVDAAGGYAGAAVQAVPYGQGHLVLSTLRFDEGALADPAAARLLENLLRFAAHVASRKPEPPPATPAAPPDDLRAPLQQQLQRFRLALGLLEREAAPCLPDLPPLARSDPPALAGMVARKNAGLDLVVTGRAAEGLALLAGLEPDALGGVRERFLRAELAFGEACAERLAAGPLAPAGRAELAARHARALRLLRLDEAEAGCALLESGAAELRSARSGD